MADEQQGIGFKGFGLDLSTRGLAPIIAIVVLVVLLAPLATIAYLVWKEGEAQIVALGRVERLINENQTEAMLDRCLRVLGPAQITELQQFGWNPALLRAKCPWLTGRIQ